MGRALGGTPEQGAQLLADLAALRDALLKAAEKA